MKLLLSMDEAEAMGLTHEGSLYGLPAWTRPTDDPAEVIAVPKFVPGWMWAWLVDQAFELATYFIREDKQLVSPIHIGESIAAIRARG